MSTTSEDTLYGGVRVINVPGIQGPRGSDGTVAPEAVIVAQNIQSVNAVAAVATEVGAVGRNISNLSTVAGSISSVETVGNNVTNVVTVANASTAVTSVAADLTNINAVAADLTNIDAASGHAQTASTKAAEATAIVTGFDAHALEKQGVFDSNASTKTSAFNTNATSKTSDFNSNASTKTTTFNTNATSKTTEFDSHVTTKTTAFDAHVEEKKALIDASVEEASGYATTASGKATEAGTHAASAKTYAIGDPAEPSSGHSAKWYSEHMALSYKGAYSSATTYNLNDFVSSASSGVTSFYISLVNSNTGNPLSDTTKWGLLFTITQGGSISWGYIQGTLSDQTDLSAALAGKQATISDLETIRSGAALGATAQQPSTTLAGYGITDASISGTAVTLGSNTVKALPAQSGMANKFLMTDGTDASWETVNSLPEQSQSTANKFLKSTGTAGSETWDTVDALPSQTGHANQFLKTDGTTASWSDVGDAFFTQIETISTVSVDPQSYTLSAFDKVHVYIDGILATENVSYTVSTYTVTFTSVLPVGTEAKFIGFKKLPLSSIPVASASQLGLVKVGSGLAIDGNGVLSSTPASAVLSSSVTLASNTVYSGTSVSTLEIAFPASYDDTFASQVNMTTGASVTFTGTGITMKGDDCADGTFTPSASASYSIMFGSVNSAKLGVVMKV